MRIRLSKNEYVFSLVTKLITVFISLLNTVIINRYLGSSLKGEYAYYINIVTILSLILNFGIGYCYSFFKRNDIKYIKTKFISLIFAQFIMYVMLFFMFSTFITNVEVRTSILIAIFVTLDLQILSICMIENINQRNKINLLTTLIYTFGLGMIFISSSRKLDYILYAYASKYIVDTFILIISFKLYKNFNIKLLSAKLIRNIFKVSFMSMAMTLLITFNYNIDIIILKSFTNNQQIGIYSVGVALASMLWIIPDAFKDVLFSKTSKNDSINEIVLSIKINLYICVLVIIGFTFLGKIFIYVMYGSEFISAFKVSLILFLGVIPMIFYKLLHPLYIAKGKQNIVVIILFISVVFNVILNFITIPIWGIVGAAISSVVSYTVCGIIFLLLFIKEYNIKIKQLILIDKTEINIMKLILKSKQASSRDLK